MYTMYYASMFQCWQLIRILVMTNHHWLRVGRHRSLVVDPFINSVIIMWSRLIRY
jgi:hypothetical protein